MKYIRMGNTIIPCNQPVSIKYLEEADKHFVCLSLLKDSPLYAIPMQAVGAVYSYKPLVSERDYSDRITDMIQEFLEDDKREGKTLELNMMELSFYIRSKFNSINKAV